MLAACVAAPPPRPVPCRTFAPPPPVVASPPVVVAEASPEKDAEPLVVVPDIVWDARERFVAAVESSSQLQHHPQGPSRDPNRIVVAQPETATRFETELAGAPVAFVGEPPKLLVTTPDGYVEWDFERDTKRQRADVAALKPACFPAVSGPFIGANDAGETILADLRGSTHKLGDALIWDPVPPIVGCAVSSDGRLVAVADARLVALYTRTKEDTLTSLRWFGAHVERLAFDPDGRWLGAEVSDLGIGAEDSWFLVHDVVRNVSHTYGIAGVAGVARGRVVNRDLWNGIAFWPPGGPAKASGANGSGDRPHALAVSPKGHFVATLAGNWGAARLELSKL